MGKEHKEIVLDQVERGKMEHEEHVKKYIPVYTDIAPDDNIDEEVKHLFWRDDYQRSESWGCREYRWNESIRV